MAFEVSELAVVNCTDHEIIRVNDSLNVTEYRNLDDFMELFGSDAVFVEQGDFKNHRDYVASSHEWMVIGPSVGLPYHSKTITIPTPVSLYPQQAAAIILENQWAQSRL